jgi:hypothetical protein
MLKSAGWVRSSRPAGDVQPYCVGDPRVYFSRSGNSIPKQYLVCLVQAGVGNLANIPIPHFKNDAHYTALLDGLAPPEVKITRRHRIVQMFYVKPFALQ